MTKNYRARLGLLARTKRTLRDEHGITDVSDWAILSSVTPYIDLYVDQECACRVSLALQELGFSGYTEASPVPGRRKVYGKFYGL